MLTAGSLLKKEREKQNLSLEDISAFTKIQKHYLKALEKDDYSKFPSPVYAKGFLRNYSRYLKMDENKMLALFRRSVSDESKAEVKDSKRQIKDFKFVVTPSTVIIASIIILVISTLSYLFYQFYQFQKPPALEIYSPKNNASVTDQEITIEGKTERDMFVTINDEAIRIEDDGSFNVSLTLTEGNNTVVIKSKHPDDIGKEAVSTRNIEYSKQEETDPEVAEEESEKDDGKEVTNAINAVISVSSESTWMEVELDGTPELTSIVQPDTELTFEADNTIYIKSGKVTTTALTINDEPQELFVGDSGVGSIICELDKNQINCQQP